MGFLRDLYDYETALYVAAVASALAVLTMMAAGPARARATWEISPK